MARMRDFFRSEGELLRQPPLPPPPPVLGKGELILVVDDEPSALRRLSDHLREMGYEVAQAHTGREALSCLESCKPSLIISDVVMPQMDGYELRRILKRRTETQAIPFIFMGARSEALEKDANGDAAIGKPVQLEQLKSAVRTALAKGVTPAEPPAKPMEAPAPDPATAPQHQLRWAGMLASPLKEKPVAPSPSAPLPKEEPAVQPIAKPTES
ncbi:MAG: response regulator, partial [Planctomycetes bacterium]|nr:response regulator [Planctomycetota bacterium]